MGFEQVTKPKDGGLVGQTARAVTQTRKLAVQGTSCTASSMAGSLSPNHCCK
jgi:hypothetical protein